MVVIRKSPNTHVCCGFTFHPGAQFVSDSFYFKSLKDDRDFKAQLASKLMEVVVKPTSDKKDGENAPKTLAEVIVKLPEEKAIGIVRETIDGVDLKEISKLDKRRGVVTAAEKQIEERQNSMNAMAPQMPKTIPAPLQIGDFE